VALVTLASSMGKARMARDEPSDRASSFIYELDLQPKPIGFFFEKGLDLLCSRAAGPSSYSLRKGLQ
jgi:hypothetical protein